MPKENDVFYCVLVDDNGHMLQTSMMTKSHAKHMLENAKELFDNRKEI